MLKEIIESVIESAKSAAFTMVYTDGSGNQDFIEILKGGKIGNTYNKNKISTSLSNIAFNVDRLEMKRMTGNVGTANQIEYLQTKAKEIWTSTKGNPQKFVKEFSKVLNLNLELV